MVSDTALNALDDEIFSSPSAARRDPGPRRRAAQQDALRWSYTAGRVA